MPLAVDLDGALVRSDLMLESIFRLGKTRPLRLLRLLPSLALGLARFKQMLAMMAMPEIGTLPYDHELVAYLRSEKDRDRRLILATAADQAVADTVASELRLFDQVLASDGAVNLSGAAKRERLVALFGKKGFDYAGHSDRDLAVWKAARRAVLVRPTARLREKAGRLLEIDHVITDGTPRLTVYLHALRMHHWTKNLLVFIPLIAAHRLYDPDRLGAALLAFAAFCGATSSIYLVNDLLDLADDRLHPDKKQRMLASGRLSLGRALGLAPAFAFVGFVLASMLPPLFSVVLALYYVLMLAYCVRLRALPVADALAVAAGYGLRVVAGAAAAELAVSLWQTIFCFLFFFGLTLLKRYAELSTMRSVQGEVGKARAYFVQDANRIALFGCSAGYLALLVLAIYIDVEQKAYPRHELFWVVWVVLLYWFSHMWLVAGRGRIKGDPVAFTLRDRVSRIAGLLALAAVLVAA